MRAYARACVRACVHVQIGSQYADGVYLSAKTVLMGRVDCLTMDTDENMLQKDEIVANCYTKAQCLYSVKPPDEVRVLMGCDVAASCWCEKVGGASLWLLLCVVVGVSLHCARLSLFLSAAQIHI